MRNFLPTLSDLYSYFAALTTPCPAPPRPRQGLDGGGGLLSISACCPNAFEAYYNPETCQAPDCVMGTYSTVFRCWIDEYQGETGGLT